MDARTLFLWMFFFHLWLNLFDFFQFLYLVFFHISIKSVSPEILSGFVYDNSAEAQKRKQELAKVRQEAIDAGKDPEEAVKEWNEYPVLHFDLSKGKHMEKEQLNRYLLEF